jgi:hypothetical protein
LNSKSAGSSCREALESVVKLGKLIYGFVAHEGFTNKDDFVRVIDRDELNGDKTMTNQYVNREACK